MKKNTITSYDKIGKIIGKFVKKKELDNFCFSIGSICVVFLQKTIRFFKITDYKDTDRIATILDSPHYTNKLLYISSQFTEVGCVGAANKYKDTFEFSFFEVHPGVREKTYWEYEFVDENYWVFEVRGLNELFWVRLALELLAYGDIDGPNN